jgi:hypothetical protein
VEGLTVVVVLLFEKNLVSDKDFTFSFILLLLSDNDLFPNTGATNIDVNNSNCSETRVIVIAFDFEVCINFIAYNLLDIINSTLEENHFSGI